MCVYALLFVCFSVSDREGERERERGREREIICKKTMYALAPGSGLRSSEEGESFSCFPAETKMPALLLAMLVKRFPVCA